MGSDLKELDRGGVQIISGTPGRVYDLIRRNALNMGSLKAMILDEADEMLNRGFKEQIYDIYRYLPSSCQVILMSATLPGTGTFVSGGPLILCSIQLHEGELILLVSVISLSSRVCTPKKL